MKRKKRLLFTLSVLLSLSAVLSGCAEKTSIDGTPVSDTKAAETFAVSYVDEDTGIDWASQNYETINLDNGSKEITKSGIYELKGTLSEGSVTVNTDKSKDSGVVYLVLNGSDITCSSGAPIYIQDAEKVVCILADETRNFLVQSSQVFTDESGGPDAAIWSDCDLTITGSGSLTVTGALKDGISCKDALRITGGKILVRSSEDGIVGRDLLASENADLTVTAGKDGLRATNDSEEGKGTVAISSGTVTVEAGGDGIDAAGTLQISGGTFTITTAGGATGAIQTREFDDWGGRIPNAGGITQGAEEDSESTKGLKGTNVLILDGTFDISALDDAVHANGALSVSGGTFTLQSDDDALHADGNLLISSGTVTVEGCYEGIEAVNAVIDGGLIAVTAADDGININDASGKLTVNGGDIRIVSGGDGLDANGTVSMTGGSVWIDGPTSDGNGAIDYQGSFEITGGIVIAAGSSAMAMLPNAGSQAAFLMYFSQTQTAGTQLIVKDGTGNTVAEYTPSKEFTSVAVSVLELKTGSDYTLYTNGSEIVSFTPTDSCTYLDETGITEARGGFGQGAGMPGGFEERPSGGQGERPDGPFNPSDGSLTPPDGSFSPPDGFGERPEMPDEGVQGGPYVLGQPTESAQP